MEMLDLDNYAVSLFSHLKWRFDMIQRKWTKWRAVAFVRCIKWTRWHAVALVRYIK